MRNRKESFFKGVIPWVIAGIILGIVVNLLNFEWEKVNLQIVFKLIGYFSFVISIVLIIIAGIMVHKVKRKLNKAKDEEYEKLEISADYATIFTSISLMMIVLAGGIFFYFEKFVEGIDIFKIIFILSFSIVCFLTSYLQFAIVNIIKKMNPEKKGNPLEMNFSKEWYKSCDEMQKQIIGEICYKTYILTNSIFVCAFILLIIFSSVCYVEISAILILGAVNIINNIVYGVYCMKIEHRKND